MNENHQVWLKDVPKSEAIEFTPLLKKYRTLLIIQYIILGSGFNLGMFTSYFLGIWEIDLKIVIYISICSVIFILFRMTILTLGFPKKGYALRQHDIHYKTGYLTRKIITVPVNRIQHLEIRQGMISKMMGLAKLKIFTAGNATTDLSLKGISAEQADEIKSLLSSKVEDYE